MTDELPPLLYLTHRIPYPPDKGDKLRSFNVLRHLALRHRVFLGAFVDRPDDARHVDTLKTWCADVRAERIEPRWRRLASLRGLLTGEALSLPYYRSRALARWVTETVARERIAVALVFSGPMAQYLAAPALTRRVIDFCDVDSAKWTQYAAGCRWPWSWVYRREGERLATFERRMALANDASLFCTDAETALFTRGAPEAAARVTTIQNGVDAEFFSPRCEPPNPYPPGGPVLVLTGAMDYWPNIDAAVWFAGQVLPLIRRSRPEVRFWIVGSNPAPAVRALAGNGVAVTGGVPDVRPYLAHADVVEAPLRIAHGIQNKVLEAMAMARPAVVSAAAATGLAAGAEKEFEVAADAEEFAALTLGLLADAARGDAMGRRAREAVRARYGWPAHLARLDDLMGRDFPV
ncbi:MAG: TIGR03087 family PEP-CTERM/XrtA system glycosyltransferase [Azoarcus sp.]|jgi:sugar transferase (PEP-CTERM/EpsH1 system associated)|nr:TIGR03087 family PEP-CTERM/XrtA system glycosyltransferase [Azoarcus sp.]